MANKPGFNVAGIDTPKESNPRPDVGGAKQAPLKFVRGDLLLLIRALQTAQACADPDREMGQLDPLVAHEWARMETRLRETFRQWFQK